jgi:hypothetical protein
MHSVHLDNAYYKPYEVKASEILKSGSLPSFANTEEFGPDDLSPESFERLT